jgi:CDP-diacylglycerol---glycerol-3-phosphate 3-phosphatidyltransferase
MAASGDKTSSQTLFNVPNQLTGARLILSLLLFAAIPSGFYAASLVIFVIAASTDWIDGYWARKYDQVTQVGRVFDPFVDKVIICGAFVLLAVEMKGMRSGIEGWMAVVVVARELLVTALRGAIEQGGGDFSAKMAGKLKMVFQCVAVGAALVALMDSDGELPAWLAWTLFLSVWLAVISTVYSGVGYVVAALRAFGEQGKDEGR